jgi:hypothetical protein
MQRPLDEILSRFTPDGSAIDRDSLLFVVGRASARPNRTWMALAGALAVTQVLTLGLLWARSPVPPSAPAPEVAPAAVAPGAPSPLPETPPPGPLALKSLSPLLDENLPTESGTDNLVPDDTPLRAFVGTAALAVD